MDITTALPLEHKSGLKPLKPMGLIESLLLFGIPAAVLAASLWLLWPALVEAGMDGAIAYTSCLTSVNMGLLVASVVGHALEGNPLTWSAYSERMRLTRMTGKIWLWTIFGTIFYLLLSLLINLIAVPLFNALEISLELPWPPVAGWMWVVILFFNIAGEELWWVEPGCCRASYGLASICTNGIRSHSCSSTLGASPSSPSAPGIPDRA